MQSPSSVGCSSIVKEIRAKIARSKTLRKSCSFFPLKFQLLFRFNLIFFLLPFFFFFFFLSFACYVTFGYVSVCFYPRRVYRGRILQRPRSRLIPRRRKSLEGSFSIQKSWFRPHTPYILSRRPPTKRSKERRSLLVVFFFFSSVDVARATSSFFLSFRWKHSGQPWASSNNFNSSIVARFASEGNDNENRREKRRDGDSRRRKKEGEGPCAPHK